MLAYAAAGEPATASHISSCQKLAAAEKAADLPPVDAAACMRFWRTRPRKHYARNIRVNAAGCKLAAGGNPCLFCCGFLSSKGKKCFLGMSGPVHSLLISWIFYKFQNFVCIRTTSGPQGPPLFWPTTFELCGPHKDQLGTLKLGFLKFTVSDVTNLNFRVRKLIQPYI